MTYPYDPDLRDYVARLLYDALPAFYKAEDERARMRQPPDPAELEQFIRALAAPLAAVRQSIEELYADFFINSANDWVLPYLARMAGTSLVFPDADSNRRDVRGTVAWRRRKGTPSMLQDLGGDLTGELVVTQEGWKRVQISQDLDILRLERITPLVRAPSLAERHQGPLGTLHMTVDARAITRTTGKYHPKHIVHWVHPTLMFPIEGGTPADLRDPATDPDLRFAFHPLGLELPLRVRRTSASDPLATDRVPPMMFAGDSRGLVRPRRPLRCSHRRPQRRSAGRHRQPASARASRCRGRNACRRRCAQPAAARRAALFRSGLGGGSCGAVPGGAQPA